MLTLCLVLRNWLQCSQIYYHLHHHLHWSILKNHYKKCKNKDISMTLVLILRSSKTSWRQPEWVNLKRRLGKQMLQSQDKGWSFRTWRNCSRGKASNNKPIKKLLNIMISVKVNVFQTFNNRFKERIKLLMSRIYCFKITNPKLMNLKGILDCNKKLLTLLPNPETKMSRKYLII